MCPHFIFSFFYSLIWGFHEICLFDASFSSTHFYFFLPGGRILPDSSFIQPDFHSEISILFRSSSPSPYGRQLGDPRYTNQGRPPASSSCFTPPFSGLFFFLLGIVPLFADLLRFPSSFSSLPPVHRFPNMKMVLVGRSSPPPA